MLAHPIELRRTEAERLDRAVAGTDAQDRSPGRDLLSVAAAAAVTEARRVPKLVTHVPSSMRSVTVAATVSDQRRRTIRRVRRHFRQLVGADVRTTEQAVTRSAVC